LPSPAPGTQRELVVHRFGRSGARPKAWLQAALHADELPGTLVLHHLMPMLAAAERNQTMLGEVCVVPTANPIGLAQQMGGRPFGRFSFDGSGNFNRGFADLREPLLEAVREQLGAGAEANAALIRAAIAGLLTEAAVADEAATLKRLLHRLAHDCDIVLDLHCDQLSSLHIYCLPRQSTAFMPLAARLGARAVLTAEDSGDVPFDEALARPWWRLIDALPQAPIASDACLSCTVELRGEADIDDQMAAADAAAIHAWLQERGLIGGAAPPPPQAFCAATPLDGVDVVKATHSGVFVSSVAPGTCVSAGQVVGTIIDPLAAPGVGRSDVTTRTDGVMFARAIPGLVRPGNTLAKIAGAQSLADRKGLLLEP